MQAISGKDSAYALLPVQLRRCTPAPRLCRPTCHRTRQRVAGADSQADSTSPVRRARQHLCGISIHEQELGFRIYDLSPRS